MTLTLLSPAFGDHTPIPVVHTCDGENLAPAIGWSGVPPHTLSFVLIVDDPDAPDPAAPQRTYVHWVTYDIPASAPELAEGGLLPDGARSGRNDADGLGYTGPCPPIGRHRYFFKLYALDVLLGAALDTPSGATKGDVEQAMAGHVLERAELVGTYGRGGGDDARG